MRDSAAMSFVMLSESQLGPKDALGAVTSGQNKDQTRSRRKTSSEDDPQQPLSRKVESNARLFEILSARSDIDHPICSECTDLLLSSMQARLASTTKERDAYVAFLKELKSNVPTAEEIARARNDLAAAKAAETKAFNELLALEQEKAGLEDELAGLESEARALDRDEAAYWRGRNALDTRLARFRDARDALAAAVAHDARQLERLQRTNVYNDTFCISHDGHFGTINGLRLGRLAPPHGVEWAEINAAWGGAALLLVTVAERLGFSFRGYVVRPMGSTSRIDRIDYPQATAHGSAASSTVTGRTAGQAGSQPQQQQPKITTLELFSSGDLPLGRQILHRRFNEAMVAFLDCLQQLGEFIEQGDPRSQRGARGRGEGGLRLPYPIEKDRIGGLSIKLGVGPDEAWTSACKYTLTCCKFLLAHASNMAAADRAGR